MSKIITDKQKIEKLLNRGVVDIIVKENLKKRLMAGGKLRVKLGIDPTGAGLHLGHMVVVRKLKEFQDLGHKIILLVGNFTAKIGDPTGRADERKPLTDKEIENNFANYARQAGKILDIKKTEVVYNAEWLKDMDFSMVAKLAGSFTVQQMLNRDMFQERLKRDLPIGLNEFLYPLMQGYDSVAIKADVELGATEQLFNLLCGRTIQRVYGQKEQDILIMPILVGLDGKAKMSKSLNNYIGVDEKPNEMYGKLMSIPDNLITHYFDLCTDININEIKKMGEAIRGDKVNPRDLKMKLASEIVKIYYDEKIARKAEIDFKNIFQKKKIPDKVPIYNTKKKNCNILDLLVETKLAQSKSEAKRLVLQKGVKVGGKIIEDINKQINIKPAGVLIQKGKRFFIKVKLGN